MSAELPRSSASSENLAGASPAGSPDGIAAGRLPEWLRRPPGGGEETVGIKRLLRQSALNTVCEEARCPNIAECFSRGTATFMILGDVCTRGCRFCAVQTGRPHFPAAGFRAEGERLAEAVVALGLRHVVITSVARDDLEDGGASGFVASIEEVRKRSPGTSIEVLIPDLRGRAEPLAELLAAGPDVLNHNLETVPRLYRRVRPGSSYARSLELLGRAKTGSKAAVKTGIMLGLGEEDEEVISLMQDARNVGVDIFTAGQYMRPTKEHLPVVEYLKPEKFQWFEQQAKAIGFPEVFIGPLVRSSYHADEAALLAGK